MRYKVKEDAKEVLKANAAVDSDFRDSTVVSLARLYISSTKDPWLAQSSVADQSNHIIDQTTQKRLHTSP